MFCSCASLSSCSLSVIPKSNCATRSRSNFSIQCAAGGTVTEPKISTAAAAEPLLLNAVRGREVERPPVWLMRQAGRAIKSSVRSILRFVRDQKMLILLWKSLYSHGKFLGLMGSFYFQTFSPLSLG